jgi:hypothetical protein
MVKHPASCSINSSSRQLTAQQFETRHLALAAFLIAGRYLKYAGLRAENGRGVFVFDDPDGRAPQLQNEFDSGAECSATLFHATVKRLRREIDAAIAQQDGVR